MKYLGNDKIQNLMQSILHSCQNNWVVADNLTFECETSLFRNINEVRSRNFYFFLNTPDTALIRIRSERIDTNVPFICAIWYVFKELADRNLLSEKAMKMMESYMVPVLIPDMQNCFASELLSLNVQCRGVDICFDYFEKNAHEPPFCILNATKLRCFSSTIYSKDFGEDVNSSLIAVYDREAKFMSRMDGVIPKELEGTQFWRLSFRLYEPYLEDADTILSMNLNEFIYYFGHSIKPYANELIRGAIVFKHHSNSNLLRYLADIQSANYDKRGL